MSRLTKSIRFTLLLSAVLLLFNGATQQISAVSGSDWQAGKITDDSIFYDNNTMTDHEIQAFLNNRVPVCDTWGSKMIGSQTRAQYGSARGYPPPYTCLKDYYEHPTTKENKLGGKPIPPGAMSAAQIIKLAADSFKINPKTLIVMLQKEQALVTDDWPADSKYRSAMGAGCPDTAPCDAQYYGFYNQVTTAARWLRKYTDNSNEYRYKPYQNNAIQYHPNTACGSSNVYIQTRATAALYVYTPYQPNQAALNNFYGTGDGCSAYGNRNYWRMFHDWFGSPYGVTFSWEPVATYILDEDKNREMPTDNLRVGEHLFVTVKARNTGTEAWSRDGVAPVYLATTREKNRLSQYCDASWPNCRRATKLKEAVVMPGETGHFEFYLAVPNDLGEFREYFEPVLENRSWMNNDAGFHIYVRTQPTYHWQWQSFDAWADAGRTTPINLNNLARNQKVYISLRAKNLSASTWYKNSGTPLRIGTSNPQDKLSQLCEGSWISCNRPAAMDQATVLSGQTATFSITLNTPNQLGEFREYLKPVMDYKGWSADSSEHIYLKAAR